MITTRDMYIAAIEKQASTSDKGDDSQQAGIREFEENKGDSRNYLGGLFDTAPAVQKNETSEIGKMFPGSAHKESGHMFLKVAFDSRLFKQASPTYLQVAFDGFCTELSKISSSY